MGCALPTEAPPSLSVPRAQAMQSGGRRGSAQPAAWRPHGPAASPRDGGAAMAAGTGSVEPPPPGQPRLRRG